MKLNSWKEHYWHTVNVSRSRIEEIVKKASSKGPRKIIEAGCNEGFLSQALKEAGHKVVSVDINEQVILKAKELFDIDVMRADIHSLPFQDGSFDIAIGGEVLEHIENPGRGLSELFRVSRESVLISLPIGEYWLGEPTHKWQIDATIIEHDQGTREELIKKVIVIEFSKRNK